MEPYREPQKTRISYRYYELPEGEQVQTLDGDDWICVYGTYAEDLHFHNLMEVGHCRWGQGFMVMDNERIDYTDGAITVIPANYLHTTLSRDRSLNCWDFLFFDPEAVLKRAYPSNPLFAESVLRRLSAQGKCFPKESGTVLETLIRMIFEEAKQDLPYRKTVIQNLIATLLLTAARMCEEPQRSMQPKSSRLQHIMPAIEYIRLHYMEPVFSEELAAACSLSEAQLRRKFREYLNLSPGEYLSLVRIQKACELLNMTNYSMTEVALQVGYRDVSSFNRTFKLLMNTSPYQYKKNNADYRGRVVNKNIPAKKGQKVPDDP